MEIVGGEKELTYDFKEWVDVSEIRPVRECYYTWFQNGIVAGLTAAGKVRKGALSPCERSVQV